MFGNLRSFKGWIQTEVSIIPSYVHNEHGRNRDTNRDLIIGANYGGAMGSSAPLNETWAPLKT